jgi:hypothetical protein
MEDKNLRLEAFYYAKLKEYWLRKRLLRMKMKIAEKYSNHVAMSKCMNLLKKKIERKHSIESACHLIKNHPLSLSEFLVTSNVSPKITKIIFAINYNRLKIMQIFFNKFKTREI